MTEPFMGQIIQGGWSFAPRGYALCNGQLMSVGQNSALFSLLGTTFGGDGQSTFALPNLQSRSMVHWGQGPGLSQIDLGESSGTENITILSANMPQHTHTLNVSGSFKSTLQQATAGSAIARSTDLDTKVNGNPAIYGPAGPQLIQPLHPVLLALPVAVFPSAAAIPIWALRM